MWCDAVDAETGQVNIDMLCDPSCWSNKRHLLDILVRLQVSSYTVKQMSSDLSTNMPVHGFYYVLFIIFIYYYLFPFSLSVLLSLSNPDSPACSTILLLQTDSHTHCATFTVFFLDLFCSSWALCFSSAAGQRLEGWVSAYCVFGQRLTEFTAAAEQPTQRLS